MSTVVTIPKEVCTFIARHLNVVNPDILQDCLEARGLEGLHVDQLKKIAKAMRKFRFVQNERYRGLSNLRKGELIQWIRRPFYLDYPVCTQLNQAAIRELQGICTAAATSAASSTCSAAQSTSTPSARQHTSTTSSSSIRTPAAAAATTTTAAPQPVFVQQHHRAGFHPPHPFHPMMMYGFYPGNAPAWAGIQINAAAPMMQLPSGLTTPRSNNRSSRSSKVASSQRSAGASQPSSTSVRVKRERSKTANESSWASSSATRTVAASASIPPLAHSTPIFNNNNFTSSGNNNNINASNSAVTDNDADTDTSSVPQNILETSLMSTLMNMGFTDGSEILTSIRRLRNEPEYATTPATNLTSDVVMLDIISQREEAEEARKMDEARLLSEQSRKEEARRLRQRNAELLTERQREASWKEWIETDEMFPHSWLLPLSNVQAAVEPTWRDGSNLHVKHKFVELIKLEKNARKWYKNDLPRAYFVNVLAAKLAACKDASAVVWEQTLNAELKRLEHQMYTLSEQQGGVPRMFLDAHDAAAPSTAAAAKDKTNCNGGDDDDDIVVLVTSPAAAVSSTKRSTAKENTFPGGSSTSPHQRKRHKPKTPNKREDNRGANDVIEIL